VAKFDYGMKNQDPIKNVVFYTKGDGDPADVMNIDENVVRLNISLLSKYGQKGSLYAIHASF